MSPDEQAIHNLVKTWLSATQSGDTATVLGLMDDDILFLTPGNQTFGKGAFAESSAGMKNLRFEGASEILELHILGDWAWMRCHLNITVTPPNAPPVTRTGQTLSILRKNPNGTWVITRDANLLGPPAP